jgi:hypothetical protein
MLSQHQTNDCINTSLTLTFEHIIKILQKHIYMEGV